MPVSNHVCTLSDLLIGCEVEEVKGRSHTQFCLVQSNTLQETYRIFIFQYAFASAHDHSGIMDEEIVRATAQACFLRIQGTDALLGISQDLVPQLCLFFWLPVLIRSLILTIVIHFLECINSPFYCEV